MSWISEQWDKLEDWADDTWEWLKDQWDDFTDGFVYYMNNFWDWFGDVFLILTGLIILGTIIWGIAAFNYVSSGLYALESWIVGGWMWISGWTMTLYSYWKDFMDWLHWDDIKRISDIGEIVSPEWKQIVDDLYSDIARVSEQLGLGSGFMLLALSDARNLILDTSSLMGRSYDIGEIAWMSNLTGYLGEFNEKAESFKNNPEGLMLDIQRYFEPDILDVRTGFQRTLVDFMGTSITGLKEIGGKLVKLKDTLEQTILHLPAQISGPIYRKIEDDFEAFDTFMDDKFTPAIDNVSAVAEILTELTGNHEVHIETIEGLMANPGKMLGNIDALSDLERLNQEAQITEISTRAYRTESRERNEIIDKDQEDGSLIAEALRKDRKPPAFLRLEYEGAKPPVSIANGVFTSWQVGDY